MFKFSDRSKKQLETCHYDLIKILNEVIKIYDITILEGKRTVEKQQQYFSEGKSKLDGINKRSKHQGYPTDKDPSHAVDIMPYKKGHNAFSGSEDDNKRFYFMAGIIYSIANKLYNDGEITHKIRWGGDWSTDFVYDVESEFTDLPHVELIV